MAYYQKIIELIQVEVEKQLSTKFGKEIKINSFTSLGGGCINHASKIETNIGPFFLKWNANCQNNIFIREAESLKELKKAAGNYLIIPEVYAAKMVDVTPGFLVQDYLLPRNSNSSDDEKLGRGLAIIHQYKNSKFGLQYYNKFK